jgi:hypothetical protein
MKTAQRLLVAALGVLVPALLVPAHSTAQCLAGSGARIAHTSLFFQPGHIRLLPAAFAETPDSDKAEASIVGFWHQKLISEGTEGVKNGTVLDNGLSQWHSDGTEILNSGSRSPVGGNFCLGVWEKVGAHTYKLNHFPLVWDATGTVFLGPSNLRAQVTLSDDGKRYHGTFTQNFYDPTGKVITGSAQGVITGTRVTSDSTPESIF